MRRFTISSFAPRLPCHPRIRARFAHTHAFPMSGETEFARVFERGMTSSRG